MPLLLCLENPLLDIQAFGTEKLLSRYGLKANDTALAEESHRSIFDDLINNHSAETTAGGGARNTARAPRYHQMPPFSNKNGQSCSQYLLPPDSVIYIGCVRRDSYANTLFAMSLSAPFIPVAFKDALDQTEPYWDYIIGNESEAQLWAQTHNIKTDNVPTIAQDLANLPRWPTPGAMV